MKYLISAFVAFFLMSCDGKKPILGDTDFQRKMNAEFKDATTSPLKDKDRKSFRGLDFFTFDSTYIVDARLKRTPDSEWFEMKTTTSRVSQERIYGLLTFEIEEERFELQIYQGKDNMKQEGFEDYLFLPFLDETNGKESYGGGRYIDLRIPKGDTIEIDFNKAYNPYCAYNEKYSCPIVPRNNYLGIPVRAGVKAFKKN